MTDFVYTVTVSFADAKLAEAWLRWLHTGHIAEVLAGGASSAEIVQMDRAVHSYEVRYRFPSRQAFARYEAEHASRLRAEGLQLFPPEKGVVYRRSAGQVLHVLPG